MNTNKLKAYAPKARIAFMEAVMKRAAVLGIYEDKISEATTEGTDTIIDGRVFTRKQGQQRQQLVNRLKTLGEGKEGYNQFINEMAFTWFNRFTAIRFMEVNEYLDHGFRVLSKEADAEFGEGFEVLSHATDVAEDLGLDKSKVVEMVLAGDKEDQLYKDLLLGQCHQLSTIMPFMFEKLDDATELLLPDNLTKSDSILKELVNDIPEDNWQEIEVIGWLYQFYISEHKDAVMGKVVKKEDIPAATQLFTPNWIVKYLVQNSLGHQWLSTYPDSELKNKMEYYITPAEQSDEVIKQLKAITPTSLNPEDLKIIDAAMGSGHILVEVYDLLREIYLEQGYRTKEIPELILTKNIYGLDIDDRACQLASFALLMKAREDDRRIFRRIEDNDIKLNLYSLQSTEHFNVNQLWTDLDLEGQLQAGQTDDLFAQNEFNASEIPAELKPYYDLLEYLKLQFLDAKNLGSLIEIDSKYLSDLTSLKTKLEEAVNNSNPTTKVTIETVLPIVSQALVLATKYDCAIKNPPYMGNKGMNQQVRNFRKKYPISKYDLFSMFIERWSKSLSDNGYVAMVVPQSWMFLGTFTSFREHLFNNFTFKNLYHMDGEELGVGFKISAFSLAKSQSKNYVTSFQRSIDSNIERVEVDINNFSMIPGSPLCYWISENELDSFVNGRKFDKYATPKAGMLTTNNEKFVRFWWEVSHEKIKFDALDSNEALHSKAKWFPYNKGGGHRKWYGNNQFIVNFEYDGKTICNYIDSQPNVKVKSNGRVTNRNYYFKKSITWSDIGFSDFAARMQKEGAIFDITGMSAFPNSENYNYILGLMNSSIMMRFMGLINPTFHFQVGDMSRIPILDGNITQLKKITANVEEAIEIARNDWDSISVSPDYKFRFTKSNSSIKSWVSDVESNTINSVKRLFNLENENNQIYSEIYNNNHNELLSIEGITLTNNYYSDNQWQHNTFLSDEFKQLISHSIGCMMGRYSFDREGLVYAHFANNDFKQLVAEGAYNTFPADDDAIVPLADQEWLFEDDATIRFREFVKTVWGEEQLTENLDFVAESLCLDAIKPKKNESSMDTIRRYFSTQFYKDHLKTYKKRPIYWLFSSGKEKAFECLVYLHRYNESTLARMRTEYVTPLMGKMEAQHRLQSELEQSASSTAEKKRLQKEIKSIEKKQTELRAFDEELKHLAEMKISIELDDGVKANYGKFGNLLHDVKGIHGKKPDPIK